MTSATRYFCPLDCGWSWDQPGIDLTDPSKTYPIADIPAPDGVDPMAFKLLAGDLLTVEAAVRQHLETHELLEWVRAIAQLKDERDQLRTGMEDLFTRWFLNAHAGLGLREAMPGIAADLRSILDNPMQTTPDNPPTSSDAANNPGEPR